jgi:hypothetical protein
MLLVLKERLEILNRLNSERCKKELVAQFIFQPTRTYAQYDHSALVPVMNETLTDDALTSSVDKSMFTSITSRVLETITSEYATENISYIKRSMIDDVVGFVVHNRNYDEEHPMYFRLRFLQLGWHGSVFKHAFVVNI